MTPLHALDNIGQSVTDSTDRTARAGIGQLLTPEIGDNLPEFLY